MLNYEDFRNKYDSFYIQSGNHIDAIIDASNAVLSNSNYTQVKLLVTRLMADELDRDFNFKNEVVKTILYNNKDVDVLVNPTSLMYVKKYICDIANCDENSIVGIHRIINKDVLLTLCATNFIAYTKNKELDDEFNNFVVGVKIIEKYTDIKVSNMKIDLKVIATIYNINEDHLKLSYAKWSNLYNINKK